MIITQRKKMTVIVSSVFAILAGTLLIQQTAFACYRHIYNNSTLDWTVTFGGPKQHGNVYFKYIACSSSENGPCVVPAGKWAEIKFTTSGKSSGGVTLEAKGNYAAATYDSGGWGGACPAYQVSSAGPVKFGHPAGDGDITITNGN